MLVQNRIEASETEIGAALADLEGCVREALCVFLNGERPVRPWSRRGCLWRSFAAVLPGAQQAVEALRVALASGSDSGEALSDGAALDAFEWAVVSLRAVTSGGDRQMAEFVAAGYRLLDALRAERTALATERPCRIALPNIDPKDYDDPYLRPVRELHEFAGRKLTPFLAGFYLHGSLATLDFAGDYSDFDTLIVVRRDVARSADRLLQLLPAYRRSLCFLFEFDPLQHHGHILLTEIELESYSDALFPVNVLDHARSLGGPWAPLIVARRGSEGAMREEFARVCAAFSDLADRRYSPDDPYNLKSFLSEMMLLPALYLQSLGRPCYKKVSFARAAPDFRAETWSVMEEASAIRAAWRYRSRIDAMALGKGGSLRIAFARWLASPELARRAASNAATTVMRDAARIAPVDAAFVARAAALAAAMRTRVRQAAGEEVTR